MLTDPKTIYFPLRLLLTLDSMFWKDLKHKRLVLVELQCVVKILVKTTLLNFQQNQDVNTHFNIQFSTHFL